MSVTIEVDLPEGLAKKAQANGLLESKCVSELISAELRRREAAAQLDTF